MGELTQWVRHGIKRGRFEMSPRMVIGVFVLAIMLTLVAVLYLMLVSHTAARGRHIEQLQVELARLQRENAQLEVDIAIEGAISRLFQRAHELGLAPAGQVEFLGLPAGEP